MKRHGNSASYSDTSVRSSYADFSGQSDLSVPGVAVRNVPAPAFSRPGPTTRVAMVERLRLVAMFEIIAFHLFGRLPILNGLGLPIFLLLSCTFSVASVEKHGMRAIAFGKIRGIGLPWLFWSGVYAVFFVLLGMHHDTPFSEVFNPMMVFYGTSEHLWFCPFIILAGVVVAYMHLKTNGHGGYWKPVVTLALACGFLLLVSSEHIISVLGAREFPIPFWAWYFSIPSLLLGLSMGQIFLLSRDDPRWMQGLAVIFALIAGVSIVFLPVEHIFRRYAVSFAVIAAAFALGRRFPFDDGLTRRLSPLMLGVYLVHVILAYPSYNLLSEHHLSWVVIVYALSLGIVASMRATGLRRLV